MGEIDRDVLEGYDEARRFHEEQARRLAELELWDSARSYIRMADHARRMGNIVAEILEERQGLSLPYAAFTRV